LGTAGAQTTTEAGRSTNVVVELKAVSSLTADHEAQLMTPAE
jgi:hypothetical protein